MAHQRMPVRLLPLMLAVAAGYDKSTVLSNLRTLGDKITDTIKIVTEAEAAMSHNMQQSACFSKNRL